MQKVLLAAIVLLLIVNAVQLQTTVDSREFATTIGKDNINLVWQLDEWKKLHNYCIDNPGQFPKFTPLDV